MELGGGIPELYFGIVNHGLEITVGLQGFADSFGVLREIYGIPESGPDYELMWENKAVLDAAGATSAPPTWADFEQDIAAVQKAGKAPISLAGKDLWPEMIWLQYLTLRYGGTAPFDKIAALKTDAWSDPAVVKAAETVSRTEPRDPSLAKTRRLLDGMFTEYARAIQARSRHRDAGHHQAERTPAADTDLGRA